jgi:D-alanyl-D-alanine dipeptidase
VADLTLPSPDRIQAMLADRRQLTYRALAKVPVKDNGEPLVPMTADPNAPIATGELKSPWIRSGALVRLSLAAQSLRRLNPRHALHVWDAHRLLSVQEAGFEKYTKVFGEKHPHLKGDDLAEYVHQHVAVPSVAGHPTGGAVDVTIVEDGKPIDMGGAYGDFDSPAYLAFAEGLTEAQRQNRARLRETMVGAGFAPFNGEWWHFSYGDPEWAALWDEPAAIYKQLEKPA